MRESVKTARKIRDAQDARKTGRTEFSKSKNRPQNPNLMSGRMSSSDTGR